MSCGFSKYELYIIWKICYKNRWCPKKHIAERDLVKGRPIHEIDQYEDAVRSLVKGGFLQGDRIFVFPNKIEAKPWKF
jgi:hypothetical protein